MSETQPDSAAGEAIYLELDKPEVTSAGITSGLIFENSTAFTVTTKIRIKPNVPSWDLIYSSTGAKWTPVVKAENLGPDAGSPDVTKTGPDVNFVSGTYEYTLVVKFPAGLPKGTYKLAFTVLQNIVPHGGVSDANLVMIT